MGDPAPAIIRERESSRGPRLRRSPPKPAGIEVDLPTLSLNLPAVKEASSEKQSSSAGRATEDDIFDLEM